jgi:hypothetical protein
MQTAHIGSKVSASGQGKATRAREMFVSAYLVEPPDLSLYATIQNLMMFAVECLNMLPSITGKNARTTEHFYTCVSHLKEIAKKQGTTFDERSKKLLSQFVDEASFTETLLRDFVEKSTAAGLPDEELIPQSAGGDIAAKATYLNWLAICLTEELKLPFSDIATDSEATH